MKGMIFDIKEFALSDGPGIRTTVFFKGCPLRCAWCHNPEGLSSARELYAVPEGCRHCGACRRPCDHPECRGLGRCLHVCPGGLLRAVGEEWEAGALAEKLLHQRDLYDLTGGGITLSGGEPLLQPAFASELLGALEGVHRVTETYGYASAEDFLSVASRCELVYFDLKLYDREAHRKYTGVSNVKILENAKILRESGIPHVFRIPLIPGITDTEDNLRALALVAGDSRVELLSYNQLAPAKYAGVGRVYPDFIRPEEARIPDISFFVNKTLRK